MRRAGSRYTRSRWLAPRGRKSALAAAAAAIAALAAVGAVIGLASDGDTPAGASAAVTDCPVTTPTQAFAPPVPYPDEPAGGFEGRWFGGAGLWTALPLNGMRWGEILSNKTFWWSAQFDARAEPNPAIVVTARRLDAPGSAAGQAPATHAFVPRLAGAAMLVGLDIPQYGCWQLRAEYRGHSLEYVVEVGPR